MESELNKCEDNSGDDNKSRDDFGNSTIPQPSNNNNNNNNNSSNCQNSNNKDDKVDGDANVVVVVGSGGGGDNDNEKNRNESESEKDVKTLTNNVEKSLSINHTVNSNIPNGLLPHDCDSDEIEYVSYKSELQMPDIMRLIQKDLSEPYSIYTYRYFIHNWPKLCFLAVHNGVYVGAVVCKLDIHRKAIRRGYIAMLAVDRKYRKRKIGSNLVLKAIRAMSADDADEVVLETEITNHPALKLYENLGFVRDKRLFRYYLNGVDALRLKLWLR